MGIVLIEFGFYFLLFGKLNNQVKSITEKAGSTDPVSSVDTQRTKEGYDEIQSLKRN